MLNKLKSIVKYLFLFLVGGLAYFGIEFLYRGHSHWTMFIVGGLCFVCVGLINNIYSWDMLIELQALFGSIIITFLEFISGLIINIGLGWNVWDYSNIQFNILGQICPQFTFFWFLLSIVIIVLDDVLRYLFFNEDKPHYTLLYNKIKKENKI